MKALTTTDTTLVYPDHNKPFRIETDASDFQLGAVIKQDNLPCAFYTRKLNKAQKNYTTIEKELLSVVETFKEFRSMILGAEIHIHTDHQNITHRLSTFTSQRILRWKILLEEFNPTFHYIPGPKNIVADSLSRTPTLATFLAHIDIDNVDYHNTTDAFVFSEMAESLMALPSCNAQTERHPVEDSYLFHPKFDPQGRHPFHFKTMLEHQQKDPHVLELPSLNPQHCFTNTLDTHPIVCRCDTSAQDSWKIVIPTDMLLPLVGWYHLITAHSTGMDKLEALIRRHFYHPDLRAACCQIISNCQICPQVRTSSRPAGQLAPRSAPLLPWSEVHVDFIGPWKVTVNKQDMTFDALTCIDPVY